MRYDSLHNPYGLLKSVIFSILYLSTIFANDYLQSLYIRWLPLPWVEDTFLRDSILYIPIFILGTAFYWRSLQESWYRYKDYFWRSTIFLVLTYLCVTIATSLLMEYFGSYLPVNQESINAALLQSSWWGSLAAIGLFGPFLEELFFRHVLIGQLSEKFPLWFCAILSVVLFIAMHMNHWSDLAAYSTVSITLVAIYIGFNKSIVHSIAFHMLNNILSLLLR